MKKLKAPLYVLLCLLAIACFDNDHNINISYKNSDRYYSMDAHFSKSKTREVEEYMDRRIGKKSNMSFINSRMDGTIALDDHTTFYIKKSLGMLKIKLDKQENSEEAFHRVKYMCEGIKSVVQNAE